ncbi:phage tail assembly chaperone family protein, TAC, partial [Pseudomonas aeruginosa]
AVTDTFDVFIKRSSFGAMERLFAQDDDKKSQNARYLAESVRLGEGGEEEIPYETAFNLDPALGFLLLQAVAEVNGTGPGDEKN